jgi:hypothetical protein
MVEQADFGERGWGEERQAVAAEYAEQTDQIETEVRSRLDRLPWSRFRRMVVIGLGTVWIPDGLGARADLRRRCARRSPRGGSSGCPGGQLAPTGERHRVDPEVTGGVSR